MQSQGEILPTMSTVQLTIFLTDAEKLTRLERAQSLVDACELPLGFYRCSVLDATIEYARRRLVACNRSWGESTPTSDRYDIFNEIWTASFQRTSVSHIGALSQQSIAPMALPVPQITGTSRKSLCKREFVAAHQPSSSHDDLAYLQRIDAMIQQTKQGTLTRGLLRSDVGKCVSELQKHVPKARTQRLARAALQGLCVPIACGLLFRGEWVGPLVVLSFVGLVGVCLFSKYVIRYHPEVYEFLLPLLESNVVPRTARLLGDIYHTTLTVTERFLERQKKQWGIGSHDSVQLTAPTNKIPAMYADATTTVNTNASFIGTKWETSVLNPPPYAPE
jgi:hypothetical protein